MKIAFGADHAGFLLKKALIEYAEYLEHQIQDMGTYSEIRADYPDFAHAVAAAVAAQNVEIGVLICGSGNGVCIAANRHSGVRAALAWLPELAQLAREHNNANVLCLPARYITIEDAKEAFELFTTSSFEGGRHAQRVEKIEL
jgi:ribose 5-phosphate isomerase B